MKNDDARSAGLVRSPLARGRRYRYAGYRSGFRVVAVAFPWHPEDDGGLPGVSVRWEGPLRHGGEGGFYPFRSEAEFWADRCSRMRMTIGHE